MISDEIQLDSSHLDFTIPNKTQYSDVILCCSTLKGSNFNFIIKSLFIFFVGQVSFRSRFAKYLHENLLKHTEDKDFREILFEVNQLLKKTIDPTTKHRQAIEYTEINTNKMKLFLYKKSIKEKMINKNEKFIKRFKDTKKNGFQGFCDEFDMIFGKKIYINEKEREIRIDKKEDLDFKYLFDVLNVTLFNMDGRNANKHFNELEIWNSLLESIENDVLGEISFDKIDIIFCNNLKAIHWNAFGKQAKKIKQLNAKYLPNLRSKPSTDYDLMNLINSLVDCEVIEMDTFQSELQPIKLRKLKQLNLSSFSSSIRITSIKEYAFYECDEIELIDLRNNKICFISEHAFHFENESDKQLRFLLDDNNITESSFALNSLKNIKRSAILNLNMNKIKYLNKKIFKPFLNANEDNQVAIDENYLKLNDERNLWFQNNNRYELKEKMFRSCLMIKRSENLEHNFVRYPLHWAAEKGTLVAVKCLVKLGADINISDKDGNTALHTAAQQKHWDVVKYLVKLGADVNIYDKYGNTALHTASQQKHWDVVKYLVKFGADVNIYDKYGNTALHTASQQKHWDVVKYLVKFSADVNIYDKYGNTALHTAAEQEQWDVVKYLVEHSADINISDGDGNTLLHMATQQKHWDIVKYLVEHDADINISDKYGRTPLHTAAALGGLDVVKYLIEHDSDVNISNKYGTTPLHTAAALGRLDVVKYLVEHGANVKISDEDGNTPLHMATQQKQWDVVKYLVEHESDVNISDKNGNTPLHMATQQKQWDVVKYLVEHESDVNISDKNGNTPLHMATQQKQWDVVKYLVEHSANINISDGDGNTPLHMAIQQKQWNVVKYLVERNAHVNISNKYGRTPLHTAAAWGRLDVVKYLVEHESDVNISDKNGNTPLHMAAKQEQWDVVKYLVEHESDVNISNKYGTTPLHTAAAWGRLDVVKYLVEHESVVNISDEDGNTPLDTAAQKGTI